MRPGAGGPRLSYVVGVIAIGLLLAVGACSDDPPPERPDATQAAPPAQTPSPRSTCTFRDLSPELVPVRPTGVAFLDAEENGFLPPCQPTTVQVAFYNIVGPYTIFGLGTVETEYTGEAAPDAVPRPAEALECNRLLTIVVEGDEPITDDDVDLLLLPEDGGAVTMGLDRDDIVTAVYDPPPESSGC